MGISLVCLFFSFSFFTIYLLCRYKEHHQIPPASNIMVVLHTANYPKEVYDYIIFEDGRVIKHINSQKPVISICLIGNFKKIPKKQMNSLQEILAKLKKDKLDLRVLTHDQVDSLIVRCCPDGLKI